MLYKIYRVAFLLGQTKENDDWWYIMNKGSYWLGNVYILANGCGKHVQQGCLLPALLAIDTMRQGNDERCFGDTRD